MICTFYQRQPSIGTLMARVVNRLRSSCSAERTIKNSFFFFQHFVTNLINAALLEISRRENNNNSIVFDD